MATHEKPAISIIIPMYNVEKYIEYCIDSLLNQKITNIEIILVDDASTDGTLSLCEKKYGDNAKIILVKQKKNRGQCIARNKGLKVARGKYVYFMDSDDEILDDGLEVLYDYAEKNKADVVHNNYYFTVYSEKRMVCQQNLWECTRGMDVSDGELCGTKAQRLEYQVMKSQPMPWLNLYKREFLIEKEIMFPDLTISEDDVFSMDVILKAEKYIRINYPVNLYRKHYCENDRVRKRFSNAIPLMERVLRSINDVFAQFSYKEIPHKLRLTLLSGWVRAHLRFWIYNIIDISEENDYESMIFQLSKWNEKYKYLLSIFIHMLDYDTGCRNGIIESRAKEKNNYLRIFNSLEDGESDKKNDYIWIYSKARRAIELNIKDGDLLLLAYKYLGESAMMQGRYDEAFLSYREAFKLSKMGTRYAYEMYDACLNILQYKECSREEIYKLHEIYNSLCKKDGVYKYSLGYRHNKIRLGYVSGRFCNCENISLYYWLFCGYDKNRFEVYCYNINDRDDVYTEEIRKMVNGMVTCSAMSYEDLAARIHEDEIDVLIDMDGHEYGNVLPVFAYKPAPIQVSGFDYRFTTGVDKVDYFITDDILDPLDKGDVDYSEKILYFPSAFCYLGRNDVKNVKAAPVVKNKYVTFGVVCEYKAISDEILMHYLTIVNNVKNSVICIYCKEFSSHSLLIDAEERLRNIGFSDECFKLEMMCADYMDCYDNVDILLDTFPYSGKQYTLAALYMGVPVISLYSDCRNTRFGLSILKHIGLTELVTNKEDSYIKIAVALANDVDLLNELHLNLRRLLLECKALNPILYLRKFENSIQEIVKNNKMLQ